MKVLPKTLNLVSPHKNSNACPRAQLKNKNSLNKSRHTWNISQSKQSGGLIGQGSNLNCSHLQSKRIYILQDESNRFQMSMVNIFNQGEKLFGNREIKIVKPQAERIGFTDINIRKRFLTARDPHLTKQNANQYMNQMSERKQDKKNKSINKVHKHPIPSLRKRPNHNNIDELGISNMKISLKPSSKQKQRPIKKQQQTINVQIYKRTYPKKAVSSAPRIRKKSSLLTPW